MLISWIVRTCIAVSSVVIASTLAACYSSGEAPVAAAAGSPHPRTALLPARAAPASPTTAAQVELGKQLFFDRRLSSTKEVSCHDCHAVVRAGDRPASGADGARVAKGVMGLVGDRNTPTVWNTGLRRALFWDGRSPSLADQAKGPLLNPVEMGNAGEHAVVAAVEAIPGYRASFEKAFGSRDRVRFEDIVSAIDAYERTLMTPDSPFDRFQRGDANALPAQALRGWGRFQSLGCVACHGSPTFTGEDYFVQFPLRPIPEEEARYDLTRDRGRYESTHRDWDRNRWRVPSLRNVALTAPYFHNGRVEKLEEAVRIMGKAQLGKTLGRDDIDDLVAFLGSLTGVAPDEVPPTLPE